MDSRERHERVQSLFLQARRLDESRRNDFVVEACGTDGVMLRELRGLLEHDQQTADSSGPDESGMRRELEALHARATQSLEQDIPESIGDYEVLRKLGEGGMGTVYEARQVNLQRTVALKVLRPGLLSAQASRRFEHEGEFLGRLQHPGIARIYDSGKAQTEFGPQPFFAMELVSGMPLTGFADSKGLSVRERLELVARIADAVQHAHQQGVIHRDLKPDNILVDDGGQPKILDFGIARASDSDVQLTTMSTDVGQILGTLAYMSPEQASGDPASIDSRSDVYSIGVLLHELLAGRLPYDVSQKSLPEALRIIQEVEPKRLSTIHGVLRGDVETIVRTCLEKDKERRYASAEALAADLRHFLRNEPIQARPASKLYTLEKFVRRNKVLVVATLMVILALSAGLIASLRFGQQEAERRREVLQLSALQEVDELVSRADGSQLWPLHPDKVDDYREWIRDAEDLVAKRVGYELSQANLRERALPASSETIEREFQNHPRHSELVLLEAQIDAAQYQLSHLSDEVPVELPALGDLDTGEPLPMMALAFEYAHPLSKPVGKGPLGLALALRAHELAPPELKAEAADLLAWAYLRLGKFEEAEQASAMALEAEADGPPEREKHFAVSRYILMQRLRAMGNPSWVINRQMQLEQLERERDELVDLMTTNRAPQFSEPGDGWWDQQLGQLMQELTDLESGLLAEDAATDAHGWSVPKRLRFALELRRGFAPGGAYSVQWEEHLPAIRASYPGLDIQAQIGLVPIGMDEHSELWEFAHLASGTPAERDEAGRLILTDETGIVLVLLPGGVFWKGAQSTNPESSNYVNLPEADGIRPVKAIDENEAPVFRVEISPFFLAKHEMTMGQWLRLTGANPSRDGPGSRNPKWNAKGAHVDLAYPVDMVSWDSCTTVCERFGLSLPTSAQWEYGARAGTGTIWWTGNSPLDLATAANLADEFAMEAGIANGWEGFESWSDGHTLSARVDEFDPNPFGLHNVHGNLAEWCQDTIGFRPRSSPYSVDPVVLPSRKSGEAQSTLRIHRGGSFRDLARYSRSAKQATAARETREESTGLRPARRLE